MPVSPEWSAKYAPRQVVDRNVAEADVKVLDTKINALRSMLGLNVQGSSVGEYSNVWLPLIGLDDALKAGQQQYLDKYGCRKPAPGAELE